MSKNQDQVLGHAEENDGIEEYDNALPDWWLALFIFTVVWGVGYAVNYHFISDHSQEKYYLAEIAKAEEKWPTPEPAENLDLSEAAVIAGKEIYTTNCVACHKADLTGGIGANLIDDEWIHGGTPKEIATTVSEGVTDKGMPAWGPILGAEKVNQVTAYIYTQNQEAR